MSYPQVIPGFPNPPHGNAVPGAPDAIDPLTAAAHAHMPPAPAAPVAPMAPMSVALLPLDGDDDADDDGSRIALIPQDSGTDEPSTIFTGIHGTGFFEEKGLKATHPDQVAANAAFTKWYKQVGELVKAGKIGTLPNAIIKGMLVLDGTKEVKIKIVDSNGRPENLEYTVGELKEIMARHKKATTGCRLDQAKADVEREVKEYFRAFDRVFKNKKVNISRISPYSASGPETRGGHLDKKPLDLNHHTPEIIHRKQTKDLILAANSGLSESSDWRSKKSNGPLSFIRRIEGIDEDETKEKQKRAIDQILRAESFCILLREKLTEKIEELNEQMQTETEDAKRATRKRRNQYTELRDKLQNDLNRHALYVAAAFAYDNNRVQLCNETILNDFYEEIYANEEEANRPSFQEFVRSPEAKPFIDYAAEAASTMIFHPGKYRRYCATQGIEPKKDHINTFVYQALKDQANFTILPISFDPRDQTAIRTMVVDARDTVDEIFRSDDDDAPFNSIDEDDAKTPEEYLKAVLSDSRFRPLFVDEKTKDLHSTGTKVKRWFSDKPHFWNKDVAESASAAAEKLLA